MRMSEAPGSISRLEGQKDQEDLIRRGWFRAAVLGLHRVTYSHQGQPKIN